MVLLTECPSVPWDLSCVAWGSAGNLIASLHSAERNPPPKKNTFFFLQRHETYSVWELWPNLTMQNVCYGPVGSCAAQQEVLLSDVCVRQIATLSLASCGKAAISNLFILENWASKKKTQWKNSEQCSDLLLTEHPKEKKRKPSFLINI